MCNNLHLSHFFLLTSNNFHTNLFSNTCNLCFIILQFHNQSQGETLGYDLEYSEFNPWSDLYDFLLTDMNLL
jgi:hypothetical protein